MSYIIIFLLTIYFSSRADLIYENITGVLILPEYRIYTMSYIIMLAWFFGYKVYKIFKLNNLPKPYILSIFSTSIIMSIGAISPYTINSNDIFSNLHVYCSMISSISFLIHLFIFFYYIKSYNYPMLHKIYPYYSKGIEFLLILTIIFGRMNGIIEIIYCAIVCLTLYFIEKK